MVALVVALVLWGARPAEAAFPGTNGKIAFVSDRLTAGNPIPPGQTQPDLEIFTMNPNGTDIQQATFNTADDRQPAWSPNGNKIAFDSFRGGDYDIVVMNPDGSRQKNRTSNSTAHEVWSDWQPIVP